MKNRYEIVCFDMDGTLITNTNSVQYLCSLNNRQDEVDKIEKKERKDEISWIEADYLKAKLFKGLPVDKVRNEFDKYVELISGIDKVITILNEKKIKSILVTAGPIQVAQILGDRFAFDKVYGSLYEVKDNKFTGNIIKHLGDSGKLECLLSYCKEKKISIEKCVAIGDSASDIKLFKNCSKSIAINYSSKLIGLADVYIKTDNLYQIIEHINAIGVGE